MRKTRGEIGEKKHFWNMAVLMMGMAALMGMVVRALGGAAEPQKKFWDNVTGLPLIPEKVMDARRDEIEFFKKQGVYEKILRTVCYERTGKAPVKVRWVDVNKGDEQHPDYRSRLVAMEFKTDSNAEWFFGPPPRSRL